MTIELSFLTAVALAGLAYLLGRLVIQRIPWLEHNFIPEPLLGGLLVALGLLLLRTTGIIVKWPTEGSSVDFLVGLLTTNMGLHITPKVLRQGFPLFLMFLGLAVLLYVTQLLLALPAAALGPYSLQTAIIGGPLSLVGAPFNLNPPSQTAPLTTLFRDSYPDLESVAQGVMMVGAVASIFLTGFIGRKLFARAGEEPPKPPPSKRGPHDSLTGFAFGETILLVLILGLLALAFLLQAALQSVLPWLKDDYLPVILLSYLLGAGFRLTYERAAKKNSFPEEPLTVLLLGPTMSFVFAYAVMSLPLHNLDLLTPRLFVGVVFGIGASVAMAWLAFPLFARFTDRYYASVIATAFVAVTTGWGPIGMGFLRRFTSVEGPVEPMPVIMPMNALFLFPWMVILVSKLLLKLFA